MAVHAAMDGLAGFLSQSLGLSHQVAKFLAADFASLPCSYALRGIPVSSPELRHAFAAGSGLVLTYLGFGLDSIPLVLLPVAVAYLSILAAPRFCGVVTFVITFSFLIGCHVWMMSGDTWKDGGMDCTGALMILVLKSTSIATDVQDLHRQRSRKKKEQEQEQKGKPGAAANGSLTNGAASAAAEGKTAPAPAPAKPQAHALAAVPSLLELLGYSFCCALHFVGPFFFFRDYKAWVEGKEEYSWQGDKTQRQPPFLPRFLRALGQAALAAVVYLYLNSLLDVSPIYTPAVYFGLPIWRRAWILYLAGTVTRWKFYIVWSLAEASMIASGLGFAGWRKVPGAGGSFRESVSWVRAENCHIVGVELASSAALFAVNWNISVGRWLRTYVYERVVPAGKKPQFIHLLITQLVAGVWHGLYPGYLLFFAGIAWEVAGSRVLFKWEKKIPEKMVVVRALAKAAHTLFASFCNNFFAIGFIVLSAKATFTAWAGLYYLGIILPGLAMAIDMALPSGRPKKAKDI